MSKTTFTQKQLEILSKWEEHFRTAVKAQWARNPGSDGLRVIYDIFTKATGDTRRFNDNCSHCILSLLHDCGEIYYGDVEEFARRGVELSSAPAEPVAKAPVKTKKSRRAK